MRKYNRKALIKDLRVDNPLVREARARLEAIDPLAQHDVSELYRLPVQLNFVAREELCLATFEISEGRREGWSRLLRGMEEYFLGIRLSIEAWDRDSRKIKTGKIDVIEAALVLCLTLGCDDEETARWLGERLGRGPSYGAIYWGRTKSHVPGFVLHLWSRYFRTTIVSEKMDAVLASGPYSRLLQSWDATSAFAGGLVEVLDYHVERHKDKGDSIIGEFSRYPFNILPVEIWAIQAVRRREGRDMPSVQHPLLEPPFGEIPPGVVRTQDNLCEKMRMLVAHCS